MFPESFNHHFTGGNPDLMNTRDPASWLSPLYFPNIKGGLPTDDPFSYYTEKRDGIKTFISVFNRTSTDPDWQFKIILPRFGRRILSDGTSTEFPDQYVHKNVLKAVNYEPEDYDDIYQLINELSSLQEDDFSTFTSQSTAYNTLSSWLLAICLINTKLRDRRIIGPVLPNIYFRSIMKFYNAFKHLGVSPADATGVSPAQACIFGVYLLKWIVTCCLERNFTPFVADDFVETSDLSIDFSFKEENKVATLWRLNIMIDEIIELYRELAEKEL